YDNTRALAELERNSKFKRLAFKQGMIRPFLLLASMHPETRATWAKTLELDLLAQPFFGDAHAEAWYGSTINPVQRFMIDKNRQGIQARANLAFKESLNPFANNCNWYEIVERVTRKAFAKDKRHLDADLRREIKAAPRKFGQTIGPCRDPHDPTAQHMEELMLRAFLRLVVAQLSDGERQAIDDMGEEQDDTDELRQRMRAAGWTDPGLIRFTIGLAQYERAKAEAMESLADDKAEAKYGKEAFCIGFNIGILQQRLWLSLAGISIEDYYP
ncbi:uncharacterized protein ACA1_160000, partial [Acanthamoeba castellanii str. Neff]